MFFTSWTLPMDQSRIKQRKNCTDTDKTAVQSLFRLQRNSFQTNKSPLFSGICSCLELLTSGANHARPVGLFLSLIFINFPPLRHFQVFR